MSFGLRNERMRRDNRGSTSTRAVVKACKTDAQTTGTSDGRNAHGKRQRVRARTILRINYGAREGICAVDQIFSRRQAKLTTLSNTRAPSVSRGERFPPSAAATAGCPPPRVFLGPKRSSQPGFRPPLFAPRVNFQLVSAALSRE